jgi:DNA polymerase-3 subunit alpha
LRHLTFEGAKSVISDTWWNSERLDFELLTISNSGYLDISWLYRFNCRSQSMGVSVEPGRGSSGIGGGLWRLPIDPLMYNLLFWAFPESDRVSLPDIDIDFDDEGRSRWWIMCPKYGSNKWRKLSHTVKWLPNRRFVIRLVYWIYLFWSR